MSRISTGTGDDGTTGMADGSRLPKAASRVEAIGAVDEANDALGVAIAYLRPEDADLAANLRAAQADLFTLGADLATPQGPGLRLPAEAVARVEGWTDALEAKLPPLRNFILPGGVPAAAHLQVARGAVRRAERAAWRLKDERGEVSPTVLVFLNRLSDWLFLAARDVNGRHGATEPVWKGGR